MILFQLNIKTSHYEIDKMSWPKCNYQKNIFTHFNFNERNVLILFGEQPVATEFT